MGREIRRVPVDFDWPLNEVWAGYLSPDSLDGEKCADCDGSGYSMYARKQRARWYGYIPFDPSETGSARLTPATPAVRDFAERNVTRAPEFYGSGEAAIVREAERLCRLWNAQWSHHLNQVDVDALIAGDRLWDFTRTLAGGNGWRPIEPAPAVTAEQVNIWSIGGFGHDSINCSIAVRAACERAGESVLCAACEGHGSTERYPGQRAEAEAWEPTDPPEGDGWQLWETTSEGSPISPVFSTADKLAGWMSDPERGDSWLPPETAARFIAEGWAPTFVGSPETGLVSGAEFIGYHATDKD
jgi:hypothetical protein